MDAAHIDACMSMETEGRVDYREVSAIARIVPTAEIARRCGLPWGRVRRVVNSRHAWARVQEEQQIRVALESLRAELLGDSSQAGAVAQEVGHGRP